MSKDIPFRLPYTLKDNTPYSFRHETESLTLQSERDNCDISKMIERFRVSGVPPVNADTESIPVFRDVSDIGDYATVMRTIAEIHSYFETLPATERAVYGNDPAVYADAMCQHQHQLQQESVLDANLDGGTGKPDSARPAPPSPSLTGDSVPSSSSGVPASDPSTNTNPSAVLPNG